MHRPHNLVWRGGQEGEEEMLAGFALPRARPGPPDAGEGERFAIIVQREPSFSGNQCGIFGWLSVYSQNDVAGTRQRKPGLSQPRQ